MSVARDAMTTPTTDAETAPGGRALIALLSPAVRPHRAAMAPHRVETVLHLDAMVTVAKAGIRSAMALRVGTARRVVMVRRVAMARRVGTARPRVVMVSRVGTARRVGTVQLRVVMIAALTPAPLRAGEAFRSAAGQVVNVLLVRRTTAPVTMIPRSPRRSRPRIWPAVLAMSSRH